MNSQIKPTADQPDPDSIKMFVGQIPRTMDEEELKSLFEEYGPVFQLNILRDKVTGQSKGCCFITFFTRKGALDAQNALHNVKTMAGMHHPVQMKPADSEKRSIEERKLFVGMITKKYDENEVRMMFAPFGMIEDCTVLRDQNGQSRGCAFITYATRQCAQNAIKSMHHSQTMEGCSSPLVVKFADTQKEKEAKKLQQMNSNLWNMSIGGLGPLGPQYLSLLQNATQTGNMNLLQNLGLTNVGLQQLLQATVASANSNPGLLSAALAGLSSGTTPLTNNLPSSSASGPGCTGANSHQSPSGDNNMHNLQNLQSLAALANATSNQSQGSMNQYNLQNLTTLNQLAAVANNSSNASGILGSSNDMSQSLQSTAQSLSQILASQAAASQASDHQSYMSLLGRTVRPLVSGSMSGTNTTNSLGSLQGLHNLSGNNISNLSNLTQGMSSSMNGIGTSGISNMSNMSNNQTNMDALSQAYSGIQQYAASFPNAFNSQTSNQLQPSASTPAGRQSEGPDGANLFIYHLPQEFHDQDLMQTFVPFGNVVSSKVFIDKQTNLSKCFGFVSYDNPLSATAAIQAMNGFQIGMKRLKVQLKRPKSESKPY